MHSKGSFIYGEKQQGVCERDAPHLKKRRDGNPCEELESHCGVGLLTNSILELHLLHPKNVSYQKRINRGGGLKI